MNAYVEERCKEVGQYVANSGCTVREAAAVFGVSKSTVHKDIRERLPQVNPQLQAIALETIERNKAERHIRGGQATHNKYKGEM